MAAFRRNRRTVLLVLLGASFFFFWPRSKSTDLQGPLIQIKDQPSPSREYQIHHEGQEIRAIAFLKVYKAASSTMQNMFYRFGMKRNLSFVLPKGGHILSKSKAVYQPIYPPVSGTKYDILCNHVIFNETKFRKMMPDEAVYIAIVREPLSRFVSAAFYYRTVWPDHYLTSLPKETFISDLIRFPEKFEKNPLLKSHTYNKMAIDFGYEFANISKVADSQVEAFIQSINKIFSLVLVVEQFDQSLVFMKRKLNWVIRDILYLKNNEYKGEMPKNFTVSEDDKELFRKREYFDYRLYEFFRNRLLKQFEVEGGDFLEEVDDFKNTLKNVQNHCIEDKESADVLHVPSSRWNKEFTVTRKDCVLMLKKEIPFFQLLVKRHNQMIAEKTREDMTGSSQQSQG